MSGLPRWSILISVLFLCSSVTYAVSGPRVKTRRGTVEGKTDGKNNVFLGIPYAAPPVGDLRWKPPQPAPKWSGVRQAAEFGYHCMQGNVFGPISFPDAGPSEDCLFLSIWKPV